MRRFAAIYAFRLPTQKSEDPRLLANHVANSGTGKVYLAPTDVNTEEKTVVQPDIFYVSNERLRLFAPDGSRFTGAPDLVIEVLSKTSVERDMNEKRTAYEKMKVREYWAVDYMNKRVYVFVPGPDGRYPDPRVLTGSAVLSTPVLPGLEIALPALWS